MPVDPLKNLSIVLVEPRGDANIGSAARAMKNCGIGRLVLVNPAPYDTEWGRGMACSALDILKSARVEKNLPDVLKGSSYVVGFTARTGRYRKPFYTYSDAMGNICDRASSGPVALVFGREDDGLTNEELDACDFVVTIPTSEEYPSLNLAQAVMVACHDIFVRSQAGHQEVRDEFMPRGSYEHVLSEWKNMLSKIGYEGELREKILSRFRDLLGRSGLARADVKMFEGLMSRLRSRHS
jgi:tRNA/rRNA methyltransferase